MPLNVLILEDDSASREALATWLTELQCMPVTASSVAEAREVLDSKIPDLALIDVGLPDGLGTELLGRCAQASISAIMMSGRGEQDDVIEALRRGASDYLTKPIDLDRLEDIIKTEKPQAGLRSQIRLLREQLLEMGKFGRMVGRSPQIRRVYDAITAVAPSSETVFLIGPTGVGKEVAAQTIHEMSPRARKPFVAVNCGAIAPSLIESEIFGHEKGAFTGAERQHQGVFEQANGGTLFLDEVTEMSPELQTRLLRTLETRRVTRIGSRTEVTLDIRIVAATNRDPQQAVADGKLREDLYYRLQVFPIEIPPLREREGDVALLTAHILDLLAVENGERKSIDDAAIRRLESHDWSGNVRELVNVVRRAYILAGKRITEKDMPLPGIVRETPIPRLPDDDDATLRFQIGESIAQVEKRLIEATLASVDDNKKRAAKILGISVKTLYSRLQVYEAELRGVS